MCAIVRRTGDIENGWDMTFKTSSIALVLAPFALTACVSAAESIIDGVADAAASAGSNLLFDAKEEGCRADPSLLAEQAVGLEFYKEKSFNIASAQCDSRFDIDLDEATFSQNYDIALRDACFTGSGAMLQTNYCTEATKDLLPANTPAQVATPTSSQTSWADYDVVSLACDHQMFRRKPNVAEDARIDVDSSACTDDGRCYRKERMVDGNREESASPANSWANAPDGSRRVDFTWDTPVQNMEQIYILTPHGVPMLNYTIEIITPTGQQFQMARTLGNTEQKICHRFNPIDVKSMFITGLSGTLATGQIFLNEVVIR